METGKNKHVHLKIKNKMLNCKFHQLPEMLRCPTVASACHGLGGNWKPRDFTGNTMLKPEELCKTNWRIWWKTFPSCQPIFSPHPSPKAAPGSYLLAEVSMWMSLISNTKLEKQFQFVQTRPCSLWILILFFLLLFPLLLPQLIKNGSAEPCWFIWHLEA